MASRVSPMPCINLAIVVYQTGTYMSYLLLQHEEINPQLEGLVYLIRLSTGSKRVIDFLMIYVFIRHVNFAGK